MKMSLGFCYRNSNHYYDEEEGLESSNNMEHENNSERLQRFMAFKVQHSVTGGLSKNGENNSMIEFF